MALIKCPECGKQISNQASSCPNCGYPIASQPRGVKIRCLSDDRMVRGFTFSWIGHNEYCAVGNVISLDIESNQRVSIKVHWGLLSPPPTTHNLIAGKCYEVKYCKPRFVEWKTVVNEVSFIS